MSTIFARIKDFVKLMFAWMMLLVFWLIIYYSELHEQVKELYYRLFGIPYYKGKDKFHYYVKRTDR